MLLQSYKGFYTVHTGSWGSWDLKEGALPVRIGFWGILYYSYIRDCSGILICNGSDSSSRCRCTKGCKEGVRMRAGSHSFVGSSSGCNLRLAVRGFGAIRLRVCL